MRLNYKKKSLLQLSRLIHNLSKLGRCEKEKKQARKKPAFEIVFNIQQRCVVFWASPR